MQGHANDHASEGNGPALPIQWKPSREPLLSAAEGLRLMQTLASIEAQISSPTLIEKRWNGICPLCGFGLAIFTARSLNSSQLPSRFWPGHLLLKPGFRQDADGLWQRTENRGRYYGTRGRAALGEFGFAIRRKRTEFFEPTELGRAAGRRDLSFEPVPLDPWEQHFVLCPGRGSGRRRCGALVWIQLSEELLSGIGPSILE
jgi:hypothetical protein